MDRARWSALALTIAAMLGLGAGCATFEHQQSSDTVRWPDDLVTTSERSGYQATESQAEVSTLLDRIAERSPIATRATLGYTSQGREIPLLILADPPVTTAAQAHESGKMIVYLQASIHGGEVCGKPAIIELARDIALNKHSPDRDLLDTMILVMGPVYNADGNDRMAVGNRGPSQNGPAMGMGERANAQGLDLNRDHMKLESPEAQSLATFLTEWNPHLTIDMHTTDGSKHQFALTYAQPQNPSGNAGPIELLRDRMLPAVSGRLEKRTGLRTFFYGNFDKSHTIWATYSHKPRFATPYRGLRNRLSILSEAYAYSTYQERVIATREFVLECLRYASEHENEIVKTLDRAERETVDAPKGEAGQLVGIRYTIAKFDTPVTIPGFERVVDAAGKPTGELAPRNYVVSHFGDFTPTLSVTRPYAYLIPMEYGRIVDKLRQHGVRVTLFSSAHSVDTETYTIDSVQRADRPFQGHRLATVEATPTRAMREWPAGTWVVPMDQPLANLVVYLLEPESDDGLATWGFFDDDLAAGDVFPVARALAPMD